MEEEEICEKCEGCEKLDECKKCEKYDDEIGVTHAVILKSGEVLLCFRTVELIRDLPNGEIMICLVCDVLDYPADGDRSMVTVNMDNVDFVQEFYHEDLWNGLMETIIAGHVVTDDENPVLYG